MESRTIDVKSFFDAQSLLDQLSLIERQLIIVQYSRQFQIDDYQSFSEIYEETYSFFEDLLENRSEGRLILNINKFSALIKYYNDILLILESDKIKAETPDFQDRVDYIVESIKIVKANLFAIFHLTEGDLSLSTEA